MSLSTEPIIEKLNKSKNETNFSDNAATVLERRYLKKDAEGTPLESSRDMLTRVAASVATVSQKKSDWLVSSPVSRPSLTTTTRLRLLSSRP